MKKTIIAGFAFLLGLTAGAQVVPDRLNYQTLLTDAGGQPLINITNTISFAIYDEAEGGNLLWTETHSITTTPKGLISVILGTGTPLHGVFAEATSVDQRYLELQVANADGSLQPAIMPRQRFLAVPYVFQANDGAQAQGDFTVGRQLHAANVGTEVGRLIMTNSLCAVTVAGDLRVDGYGKSGATVSILSNSSVQATSANDALHVEGGLTANQSWRVAGTGVFYHGVSAANPVFKKGVHVNGNLRALGGYQSLGANLTSLAQRTATGDGFALVYFKTDGWGDDANLVVTVGTNQFLMQHRPYSAGADYDLHFYDTACIPISKGSTWSVGFSSSGSYKNSKFDVYWIPFGF